MVPTKDINVPRERVTSVWDPSLLEEMRESVRSKGILEPVQLLRINGALWLTDGLHRIQVAEEFNIEKVPALIKEGTTEDLLIENIIRNRQRGKSNPAQEAEVLYFLTHTRGFPLETASKQIGCSVGWAKKLLRLASLPDEVKDFLKHGKIPVTGAFYLADLPDPESKLSVARDASEYGYNAHQMKARVAQLLNPDIEPQGGDVTFTSNGKPQRVPLRCSFCQDELPSVGKQYVWTCSKCEALARDLIKSYNQALQEAANQARGQPPQPPNTPG